MVMGYALEDFWGEEWEKRYRACVAEPRIDKRVISVKEIVRLILKSVVETGTPFAFYRDTVNRLNPNPQAGMIYCSNLCTEIAQNMSPVEAISTEIRTKDGDTVVQVTTRPGDFVVCNLASLNLGRIDVTSHEELRTVVRTAVRALDNVIDLNEAPLAYAKLTNAKYRSIGLGVSGYHHMLAKNAIRWESEEHLAFVDDVFARINYAAIEASSDLAAEKGTYGCFAGSDWQTGAYFKKRGYISEAWQKLAAKVRAQGMRNAYLLAVAPTSSTSILVGTTAGVDPIMKRFFLEEKKGAILPRIAPDLSMKTYWYYKSAHTVDQAGRCARPACASATSTRRRASTSTSRTTSPSARCSRSTSGPTRRASRPSTTCAASRSKWRSARAAPREHPASNQQQADRQTERKGKWHHSRSARSSIPRAILTSRSADSSAAIRRT